MGALRQHKSAAQGIGTKKNAWGQSVGSPSLDLENTLVLSIPWPQVTRGTRAYTWAVGLHAPIPHKGQAKEAIPAHQGDLLRDRPGLQKCGGSAEATES